MYDIVTICFQLFNTFKIIVISALGNNINLKKLRLKIIQRIIKTCSKRGNISKSTDINLLYKL